MIVQTFVVGLGRAGAGLHIPVLARARSAARPLFDTLPIVACDPRRTVQDSAEVTVTSTFEQAERLLVPAKTVVHVCTPPAVRVTVLAELAELGFRRFIVEKPLAVDTDELARVIRLRRKFGLHLEIVEPWLTSTLTKRLTKLVRGSALGELKSISIVQNKPRFRRSLLAPGHPSAFDVELPHGVGVALRLAGNARVTHSAGQDLVMGELVVPRMGGAQIGLRHNSGVRTLIESDLTSPVRERRITCEFSQGSAVGHYAVSDDDDHAQFTVIQDGQATRTVLRDDSLTAWMIRAYRNFHAGADQLSAGLDFAAEVVRILAVAKNICAEPVTGERRARNAG
ncbi:Gfo/Idh/MocA family oxidoreductase [Amycolatopsis sp. cg5]|uniref:Gfo/Idh/MocA family oxidoreductase n=1 Tax=Amycolatopsis sp. cg5 TaxID=3238802 RepID=UPI0035243ECE